MTRGVVYRSSKLEKHDLGRHADPHRDAADAQPSRDDEMAVLLHDMAVAVTLPVARWEDRRAPEHANLAAMCMAGVCGRAACICSALTPMRKPRMKRRKVRVLKNYLNAAKCTE